ncbi:MAG: glycosyltransferase [Candidatus Kaelpia aquatica]|nr:glycosyltransferase [Candidatus Kaelpia aquatica]
MGNAIEIILPVYNEQDILERNVLKIKAFLEEHKFDFLITIIDNGSTDKTFDVAKNLEKRFSSILTFKLNTKGRGRALRFRITNSIWPVIGYMDIDLSADLHYFLEMYGQIKVGNDIVIGSRLINPSLVTRSFLRRFLSKGYNALVRGVLKLPCFDCQCGFKIFRREAALSLLYLVENNNWFFDTELLFYAYRRRLKIKEIAIIWNERKKTKVKLFKTVIEDIKGILRLALNDKL